MDAIEGDLEGYLYFHSTRGAFCADLGDIDGACAAYEKALTLGPSDAERSYIEDKLSTLKK